MRFLLSLQLSVSSAALLSYNQFSNCSPAVTPCCALQNPGHANIRLKPLVQLA
jgi:hypothetical protein